METERKDKILGRLIDEGFLTLEFNNYGDIEDTCLICRPKVTFTVSKDRLMDNEWSENDSIASKELAEHLMENHPEHLTLMSMKIGSEA